MRPYLKKPFTKIGLVEWLKMKALSSIKSQYWGGKKKNSLGLAKCSSGRLPARGVKP
jgi:hypothetical protein